MKRIVSKMRRNFILKIIIIVFVFLPILFFAYWWFLSINRSQNWNKNKKELFGRFTLYNNEVYVVVPGSGYYHMPKVDKSSFHAISDKYQDRHIGIDKNNVYCGNCIIPKMNSNSVKPLGNNYYSDSKITYYCGRGTKRNANLEWYKEFCQKIKYDLFNGNKPQTWFYPMKALPDSDTTYYALLEHSIATNGKQVYCNGELMPQANPKNLRSIKSYHFDLMDKWRKSNVYFGDGKNVYFQHQLLPLSDDESLYSIEGKYYSGDVYLIDPRNGMVYVNIIPDDNKTYPNTTPFDKQNAPYTLISEANKHVYHTLWLSKNGLFFYDTKAKEVKRAGQNPFLNKNFKEIAPLVFYNGKQTLFVDGYQVWGDRKNPGLKMMCTHISELNDLPKGLWQELKKTRFYSVWAKGNEYYLFDNWGEAQLIHHTIYKIVDTATLTLLLNQEEMNRNDLQKIINEKKLIIPPSTEIIAAKSRFDKFLERWLRKWWLWGILVLVFFIGKHYLKEKKLKL